MVRGHAARPILWCLLAALLFGASTPASKVLLDGLGPLTLAGFLYLGAALGALPFARRGAAPGAWRDRLNVGRLAGAVVFGGVLGPVLLLVGLKHSPAASVALWLNLEAVATALLGWACFREHLEARSAAALALIVGGGVLLALPAGTSDLVPALLVAGACVCWGLDNNLTSLIGGFTPAQTTLVKGASAGAFNLLLGLLLGGPLPGPKLMLLALAVGALSYGFSIALYVASSQQLGAIRSQVVFSTAPLFGVLLAWLALGETMTPVTLGAGALMVLGMGLLLRETHGHPHAHDRLAHSHGHRHDDGHHDHGGSLDHDDVPAWAWHVHPHVHEPRQHAHPHHPDLHHRHGHPAEPR